MKSWSHFCFLGPLPRISCGCKQAETRLNHPPTHSLQSNLHRVTQLSPSLSAWLPGLVTPSLLSWNIISSLSRWEVGLKIFTECIYTYIVYWTPKASLILCIMKIQPDTWLQFDQGFLKIERYFFPKDFWCFLNTMCHGRPSLSTWKKTWYLHLKRECWPDPGVGCAGRRQQKQVTHHTLHHSSY